MREILQQAVPRLVLIGIPVRKSIYVDTLVHNKYPIYYMPMCLRMRATSHVAPLNSVVAVSFFFVVVVGERGRLVEACVVAQPPWGWFGLVLIVGWIVYVVLAGRWLCK